MTPVDHFQCPSCRGRLQTDTRAMRCLMCARQYPIILGVPLLVRDAEIRSSSFCVPEHILNAVCEAYEITPDTASYDFVSSLFSYSYRFDDLALDSENNYLLNRIGLQDASPRKRLSSAAAGCIAKVEYR